MSFGSAILKNCVTSQRLFPYFHQSVLIDYGIHLGLPLVSCTSTSVGNKQLPINIQFAGKICLLTSFRDTCFTTTPFLSDMTGKEVVAFKEFQKIIQYPQLKVVEVISNPLF